jgi:hypothetical protein
MQLPQITGIHCLSILTFRDLLWVKTIKGGAQLGDKGKFFSSTIFLFFIVFEKLK